MTTKKLSLVYGTNLDYKLIRDGYKTVNGSVVVDENTPKTISLEVPQEIYSLPNVININTDTKSAPIVTLTEDLELPDGAICPEKEYILGEYGKEFFIPNNDHINNNIAKQAGKYLHGILDSSIKDVSEEKIYNLYDVQTDVRSLILSEDKNINVDNIEFIEYCGQVTIPSHTVYEYDTTNNIWSNLPVTINYNIPEGAIITINENTVTSSPYVTDEIGEIVYKVNKEGYEEYIGQIDYAFGGSTYEITITEDNMISNSSSEGPSISPDTPSLTRQYYAFTPTNNAFLTSANTNGNINGDTSTFYATSEEVGTHQILYMLNPETGNMIEITNVELTITSSSLSVYPLTTGPLFFTPPKQTDAVRNSTKDIVANATPEASTTATITSESVYA